MESYRKSTRASRSLVLVISLLVGAEALAQRTWKNPSSSPSGSASFRKRSGADKSRWTLKDWLEQKERNKMMDLWLGMYSPSPYEVILSAAQIDYRADVSNPVATFNQKSWVGSLHFFAMILGIGAQYENNWNEQFSDLQGSINFRVAGNSNESTHLNIFGGLRNRVEANMNLQAQPFAGAELDLYVQNQWGLHGNYRSFFAKDVDLVGSLTGARTEGGIFIEYESVRLFGNWYSESLITAPTGGATPVTRTRTGWHSGLRLLF